LQSQTFKGGKCWWIL